MKQRDALKGRPEASGKLARRAYGKTGIELSIIGFGGIVVKGAEPQHAAQVVAEAVEKGVNYFDVAPTYGDAEEKLGPALEPYREGVFLACKTTQRQAPAAREEFERSLARLRTDRFDLYQLHALTDVEKDVDAAFASDGVMKMVEEERRAGRIRHVGFSAHSEEAALAALDRYDFDSVLWPVNFAASFRGDFGPRVVERAREKGAAVLALKALAKRKWPEGADRGRFKNTWYEPVSDPEEAALALRFTLSQPVTAAIPPGEEELWRLAVDLAMGFEPVTEGDLARLREMAERLNPVFAAASA